LIGAPAKRRFKTLAFVRLFRHHRIIAIIVMQCGPIDLVTADPRQLK
jgi:hypothetical protein